MNTFDYIGEKESCEEKVRNAADERQLEAVRIEYLGRKGKIALMYADLAKMPQEIKPGAGKKINELRADVTRLIEEKRNEIKSKNRRDAQKALDVTIPGAAPAAGHTHILPQTIDEICAIFERLGYVVREGPEVETEFNNFTALNIPAEHPSRDSFDTFYLKQRDPQDKAANLLLRSHTSPAQIRIMK